MHLHVELWLIYHSIPYFTTSEEDYYVKKIFNNDSNDVIVKKNQRVNYNVTSAIYNNRINNNYRKTEISKRIKIIKLKKSFVYINQVEIYQNAVTGIIDLFFVICR